MTEKEQQKFKSEPQKLTERTYSSTTAKPSPISFTPNSFRLLIIGILVVSLIVGGAAGLVFSTWSSSNAAVSSWIQRNIFGQVSTAAGNSIISGPTISVVENSAVIDAVKKVEPTVVSIVVTQDLSKVYGSTGPNVFPFNYFYQNAPQGQQEVGAGSGFIISSDGYILTNRHVVDTAGAQYTVVMNDGKQYDATVVATDPSNDIAVVKINATNLPTVEFGDSSALQVGQTVIAIGNALGQYSNTVTKGIVSGLARTVIAGDAQGSSETLDNIIQTDAAINLGNSGGPLINLSGQVVGINTAISQSGQLVGFAIPINQVKSAVDSVKKTGKIVRPFLGVRYVLVNDEVAKQDKLSVNYGALIVNGSTPDQPAVATGSPAEKAGLAANDVILEINGQQINETHSLSSLIQQYSPGQTVTLKILHAGQQKTISVVLGETKG